MCPGSGLAAPATEKVRRLSHDWHQPSALSARAPRGSQSVLAEAFDLRLEGFELGIHALVFNTQHVFNYRAADTRPVYIEEKLPLQIIASKHVAGLQELKTLNLSSARLPLADGGEEFILHEGDEGVSRLGLWQPELKHGHGGVPFHFGISDHASSD
jgi:hypothetical protein